MDPSSDHTWSAQWIWTDAEPPADTVVALFRRAFDLEAAPATAQLRITADTFYRLYLNGEFIAWGPARSSRGHATVDLLDIADHLKPGRNVLAVAVVWETPGDILFEALSQAPGLLAELVADGELLAATDSSWSARLLTGQPPAGTRFSPQRGLLEEWDTRLTAGWDELDDDASGWGPAWEIGPVGTPPWEQVELRDVPLLQMAVALPQIVEEHGRSDGCDTGNFPPDPNECTPEWISRLQTEGLHADATAVEGLAQWAGGGELTLHGPGAYVALAWPRSEVGFLELEVEGTAGEVVEAVFHERHSRDGSLRPRDYLASNSAARWVLAGGRQTLTTFLPQLVRYARVVHRGEGALRLHSVRVRACRFPSTYAGGMTCSDPVLNEVVEAARHTVALNTAEIFMDCPSRERGGWLHDSYFNAMAACYLLGDLSVNRRMCRQIAESQGWLEPPAMLQMVYPANCPPDSFIPAHALMWVPQVGLDLRFTGDGALLKQLTPNLTALLEVFEQWRGEEGLLDSIHAWNFLDWGDIDVKGVSLGLNAVHILALEEAAELLGRADWHKQANKIRRAINQLCPGEGLYPDNLLRGEDGLLHPGTNFSETTQIYLLEAGVPSAKRAKAIWRRLRELPMAGGEWQPRYGDLARAGVFGMLHRLQVAALRGDWERLAGDAREFWGYQAATEPGTLWETSDGSCSRCHGFAAAVAARLMQWILGLRPADDLAARGFVGATIEPHPAGLAWARGWLTTPAGLISVRWENEPDRFVLELSAAEGIHPTIILPEEARRIFLAEAVGDWEPRMIVEYNARIRVTPGKLQVEPLPVG